MSGAVAVTTYGTEPPDVPFLIGNRDLYTPDQALLAATCSAEVTTEHVYLALITPPDESDEHSEEVSS